MSDRDLALLNLLGVVQHAIGNLNLNDPAAALRTLMDGYEKYVRAEEEVHAIQPQSEKENSHVSSSAA